VAHLATTHLSLSESLRLATENPARFLGRTGKLQVGAPGDLVRFTFEPVAGIQIESVLLQGTRVERKERWR
jgi:N-acetylglucosamine-6-phosphate deacetylase